MFIRLKNKMKHGKAINPDIVNADGLLGIISTHLSLTVRRRNTPANP